MVLKMQGLEPSQGGPWGPGEKQRANENLLRDFPGGPVIKSLPFNVGDSSSNPGRGTNIPHAAGHLRGCVPQRSVSHSVMSDSLQPHGL